MASFHVIGFVCMTLLFYLICFLQRIHTYIYYIQNMASGLFSHTVRLVLRVLLISINRGQISLLPKPVSYKERIEVTLKSMDGT